VQPFLSAGPYLLSVTSIYVCPFICWHLSAAELNTTETCVTSAVADLSTLVLLSNTLSLRTYVELREKTRFFVETLRGFQLT